MSKKCTKIRNALVVMAFTAFLCTMGNDICFPKMQAVKAAEISVIGTEVPEKTDTTQMTEELPQIRDLTEAFEVILQGATKEFIAGYVIDEAFLMWLDAQYGDNLIIELAYCVLDGEMDTKVWYEKTGESIHVLWLRFCQDSGFQSYRLDNVYWQETASATEAVFSFTGDFNFAEGWYTTEYMKAQPGGIEDCFSANLLDEMRRSDVLIMNNEFAYAEEGRGMAVPGKAYAFRAEPKTVELLKVFGTDAVTLANNHVYDYGEIGLLDTLSCLNEAEMPYLGAGKDIDEASKILYYVVNGRKVAIVSATQIERTTKYTREATETSCGVFKTLNPERFLQVIRQAKANSDYVIAIVHWGTEGNLMPENSQRELARKYVEAGVDAIIGGHPHRLQGINYMEGIPVAYSLGNFWFSDGTLYTTLAQVVISEDGSLALRFLPCVQKNLVTSLLTEEEEQIGFYQYLAAISSGIGIDAEGNIYDKMAEEYPAEKIVYDSEICTTEIRGVMDNEGNAIDIVGNLK